ncbi:M15 family metallopeptidase [Enterococcus sp. LJL98]
MKIKKGISYSVLIIIGCLLIYVTNRFVTRPYVSTEGEETAMIEHPKEMKTKEAPQVALPDGQRDDWNLRLVSPQSPLESDIPEETFLTLSNGMMIDRRIEAAYTQLNEAAEAAGFPLVLVSAYRSISYQEQIFQEYLNQWISQGYSEEEALKKVKETSTEPGFSEHHTGLAIDIVDEEWSMNYPEEMLDADYAQTPGAKWLAAHAREYGFILRYPQGKEKQTAIHFEPWHFRYVGVEHARYIEENELCLEEYLDLVKEK